MRFVNMRTLKWTFRIVVALFVIGFLHYTLPQHDIVRVVGTYEERQDFDWTRIFWASPEDQSAGLSNRDVLFIQTIKANGKPMVYRNEDTGWGWPPYFKFDTASLQTEAADAVSDKDNPKWYVITHYGWRNEFLSIFPNAISIRPVEGPDVRIIPWASIIILTVLALIVLLLWRMWQQFKERNIDPLLEDVGEASAAAQDKAHGILGRLTRWLRSWRRP